MSPSPVKPQIVDVIFTKNTPEEGESTTATCQWTGEPEPTVTWFKDGEKLVEADVSGIKIVVETKSSELRIEEVDLGDTGNYACNVSNDAGFDTQTKRLEVQGVLCVYVCVHAHGICVKCVFCFYFTIFSLSCLPSRPPCAWLE